MSSDTRARRPEPAPTCGEVAENLVRASFEPLDGAQERELRDHLALCPSCRREAIEVAEVVAGLRVADRTLLPAAAQVATRAAARLAVAKRPIAVVRPAAAPASPRRRILSAAALGVSLAANAALVLLALRPATDAAVKSTDRAEVALGASLGRLRAAQGADGLVDGDPVATAWWILAESRSPKSVSHESADRMVDARRALAAAPALTELSRSARALALGEPAGRRCEAGLRPAGPALMQVEARRGAAPAARTAQPGVEDLARGDVRGILASWVRLEEGDARELEPMRDALLERVAAAPARSPRGEALAALAAATLLHDTLLHDRQ